MLIFGFSFDSASLCYTCIYRSFVRFIYVHGISRCCCWHFIFTSNKLITSNCSKESFGASELTIWFVYIREDERATSKPPVQIVSISKSTVKWFTLLASCMAIFIGYSVHVWESVRARAANMRTHTLCTPENYVSLKTNFKHRNERSIEHETRQLPVAFLY